MTHAKENNGAVLSVRNLKTYFKTEDGMSLAVDDVSFDIPAGKIVHLRAYIVNPILWFTVLTVIITLN